MVLVKGGTFRMGSKDGEDDKKPVHEVTLRNFYIGQFEVTQKQWKEIMGNNPSHFKGDNLPIENVSWNDVQDFLKKLNNRFPGKNYRLPTEAEWEYAARGGEPGAKDNFKYAGSNNLSEVGWYNENSGSKTHPVGGKKPKQLGLYDMSGNVWEWCADCWNDNYQGAPADGSAWTTGNCDRRVLRGGSYNFYDVSVTDCRFAIGSGYRDGIIGFRLVRTVR